MIPFIVYSKQIIDKFNRDEMTVYAAQASFFIIIAAFPFIMLLLTVIQLVPSIGQEDLWQVLMAVIPEAFSSIVFEIVNSLYTQSPGTILSITAITALWSASRGMLSMERGLERVLESKEKRNYIINRLVCVGYTIIFIIVCIMSLILLVFGTTLQDFVVRTFPLVGHLITYLISFRTLFAVTIMAYSFTMLYTFVPKKKLRWRDQLPGAFFSTTVWIIFSLAFSIYFENFGKYSKIYGGLTAVVLLMLWLYFCICILFFGAEINYYYTQFKSSVYHKSEFYSS